MDYYAGLDVSLEETAVCVVDATGIVVKEAKVASSPEALIGFFERLGLVMGRIGLEACSQTAWLHERMSSAGLSVVCMETRQAKAAMGAMPVKTDRNDARALAQIVRTGWFRPVHVKSIRYGQACFWFQAYPFWMSVLAKTTSLRMTAVMASFGGLPASTSRW